MTKRALVFDFDGVILDTEGPVFTAWCEAFAEHGCPPLTVEEWAAEIGTAGGLDTLGLLQARATRAVDVAAVDARRRARRDELLAVERVRPGVEAWLDEAAALGWGIAIASSSTTPWVERHLARTGLGDRFAHIACRSAHVAPKPAPDSYLAACRALGVDPRDAIAIEDSPHGISAAKAAGLRCVAVPHAITAQLDTSHADLVVSSLADLTLRDALARIS